jgi:SAM-dependent methyltransferase
MRKDSLRIMNKYSEDFYKAVAVRAQEAAIMTAEYILDNISIHSVQDVGCGYGVWLKEFMERISGGRFLAIDHEGSRFELLDRRDKRLTIQTINLEQHAPVNGEIFDLSICLEVLEHIPENSARKVLDYLSDTSKLLLFSAATPGQGGTHHVNENSAIYWHSELIARGFVQIDVMRPLFKSNSKIPLYYRNNSYLYINLNSNSAFELKINWRGLLSQLVIPARDIRSIRTKFQYFLTSLIPVPIVTWITKLLFKKRMQS